MRIWFCLHLNANTHTPMVTSTGGGNLSNGVVCWTVGTLACGFSQSFGQLFASRLVVGLGEAVLSHAARWRRPTVMNNPPSCPKLFIQPSCASHASGLQVSPEADSR